MNPEGRTDDGRSVEEGKGSHGKMEEKEELGTQVGEGIE